VVYGLSLSNKTLVAGMMLGLSGAPFALEPFASCPTNAFLFQGNPVSIYGVNLLTGQYNLLEADAGISGNINAVGFSFDDRFIYGFNTTRYSVVKMGKDLQAIELPVTGLPANTTFYVGDVSENVFWVYRKNTGLFHIQLDENHPDYLNAIKVESADVSLTLTDFAFHPGNGGLYAVDNKTGGLYNISTVDGSTQLLGSTGISGTFGAGYFDLDGYYYISRNSDGLIYRINMTDPESPVAEAQFFAYGPNSNQNDGARCAFAALDISDVDWGDAPDSYGTTLVSNGARHQLSETLYLGSLATDGELDGLPWPLSDDDDGVADEDGVSWTTEWKVGLDTEISFDVTGLGFIDAWVDWNQDGEFHLEDDRIAQALVVVPGENRLPVRIPNDAAVGSTWIRVRLSTSDEMTPTGGALDGEVEDHPVTIQNSVLTKRYYPSMTGWVTLAYEDTWPTVGDYDMNDVVMHYRLVETIEGDEIRRIDIQGEVLALGAHYQSGFAVGLTGILSSQIDQNGTHYWHSGNRYFRPLIRQTDDTIIDVIPDLEYWVGSQCPFYRSDASCQESLTTTFDVSVPFIEGVVSTSLPDFPYNPFIFGVKDHWRGEWLMAYEKNRVEVHLPMLPGTSEVPIALWGVADDDSRPNAGRHYRTDQNLPWALLIPSEWDHPKEGISIVTAYPDFATWVESSGLESIDWYASENANPDQVYP